MDQSIPFYIASLTRTTTSDICQLRSHIKAVEKIIHDNANPVPNNIVVQFEEIEKLFGQLLSCNNLMGIHGDYPAHPDFLEKSKEDKLHQVATDFLVALIGRGKKMMFTVTEDDKNISPYMRLITKMLQGIGFELLHYIKVLQYQQL